MGCCGAETKETQRPSVQPSKAEEPKTNAELSKAKTKKPEQKKANESNKDIQKIFTKNNFNAKKFLEQELAETNRLRKLHGAEPLKLNQDLVDMAQNYANKLAAAGKFEHSKNRNLKGHEGEWVGENIYWMGSSDEAQYSTGSMTQNWYDEIKDYDFKTGKSKNGRMVGHFTQVVWKATKEVGFGVGFNGGQLIGVGNYYPGGNFNNAELQNVGNLV